MAPRKTNATTVVTTRWDIPTATSEEVEVLVKIINKVHAANDMLPLQIPEEGYSCTVESDLFLVEELLFPEIKIDTATDVQLAIEEFYNFCNMNTMPYNHILVTVYNQ